MELAGWDKIRIYILLFYLVLLNACATFGTVSSTQKAGAYYKIGVAYLNENRIQQAFVEFQKAYELNPKDKNTVNAIGIIYLQHFDEISKAIEYFEKAVEADHNFSEAYNNLGVANEKSGRFETAISFYKKAVSNLTYSTPDKAYTSMGNSYYRLGRYMDAVSSFKEAIKRAPELSLPYWGLSLCYNAMGRYGDASTAITQAIKLDPVYKGDSEKAVEDLNIKKLMAKGYEEQDLRDYIEIIRY